MEYRVRVLAVTVTAHLVADDGETLEEVNIQPLRMTPAQFAEFDLMAQVANVEAHLNTTG